MSSPGKQDALSRAEVLLASALRLDSTYLPPLARLVDVAGYEHNPDKLRRYGKLYLARDSSEEEFVAEMNRRAEAQIDDATGRRLFDAGNPVDFYAGLKRYWSQVEA